MFQQPSDTNSAQWQAIDYQGAHLLIVAGPGTGKTHTLTYRIAKLISEKAKGILAITFTKKAAEEMRKRVVQKIGEGRKNIFIGTFHQYCLNVLRAESQKLNMERDFLILNDVQKIKIGIKLWPQEKSSKHRTRFEKISQWKNLVFHAEIPQDVLRYNEVLRKMQLLDYDDILLETLRLFDEFDKVLKKEQERFSEIFVDEYQDINPVQYELLKRLIGDSGRLTAIGDPNQAIYGFRGSNVGYFHSFADDYCDAKLVSLSDNYRSSESLLSASAQVMNNDGHIFVPELTANIYTQGRLTIHEAHTEKGESEYVVHSIEKLMGGISMFSRDSGRVGEEETINIGFGDIAVLYRMHLQAKQLIVAFERSGIPYHVVEKNKMEDDAVGPEYEQNLSFKPDKVSLMSLHAAKGLEFQAVFIVGCEEGLIPLNVGNLCGDIDEERRLFYVGMTRAKNFLFCTRAKRRIIFGKRYANNISQFLCVIKKQLKQIDLPQKLPKKKKDQQMDLFSS